MPRRTMDWLKQAKRDFEHSKLDLKEGFYEWACFSAQQAAEKEAKEAIEYADEIIRFCDDNIS